jgi:hypothetical protein
VDNATRGDSADEASAAITHRSVATASFKILDVEVIGHVLEDGKRVIETDGFEQVMLAMSDPHRGGRVDLMELQRFIDWKQGR